MTTAITGTPELLIKLRQDLIEKGFDDDKEWNDKFLIAEDMKHLRVVPSSRFFFYSCSHEPKDAVLPLTPSNYTETLNQLIQTYKK